MTQKLHPSLTPARVRELSGLAKAIDCEEADSLKAEARRMFGRAEKARMLIRELRGIRLEKNLTLDEVGEASEIGKANLCRLEMHPDPNPTLDTLIRYAEVLGVDLSITMRRT